MKVVESVSTRNTMELKVKQNERIDGLNTRFARNTDITIAIQQRTLSNARPQKENQMETQREQFKERCSIEYSN